MTVGRWDQEAWNKQHMRTGAKPKNRKPLASIAIAAFVVLAAGVSATQVPETAEQIGVCHYTPEGYVFLVVAKDGYEHGHHRHNPDNYFVAPTAGCGGDQPWSDVEPIQDVEEIEEVDDIGEVEAPEPVDNATAPEDNATEELAEEPVNETVPDAAARLAVQQDDESAYVTVQALSLGDGAVEDAGLSMELPNVGRAWTLSGADAADCVLGERLDCWFGTLEAGQGKEILLVAHLDQLPCGDGITLTATVAALEDAESRNDASSAGILPRSC